MTYRIEPAEAFPLSDYLREELAARKQSVAEVCRGTAMTPEGLQAILDHPDYFLTFREAVWLAEALGVSVTLLLNLQLAYRKWKKRQKGE